MTKKELKKEELNGSSTHAQISFFSNKALIFWLQISISFSPYNGLDG
jgi:hypothetical protein